MSQLIQRFEAAVQVLVADGPVKTRLLTAYSEHLEALRQVDLPIAGNLEFTELHDAMHSTAPVGSIDRVRASVQKMSPAEAGWHARTIVRLYAEVLALERSARVAAEGALAPPPDRPPAFLAVRN